MTSFYSISIAMQNKEMETWLFLRVPYVLEMRDTWTLTNFWVSINIKINFMNYDVAEVTIPKGKEEF